MNASLRPSRPADYAVIASWISDAASCLRWAGPRLQFPFAPAELELRLVQGDGASYCLVDDNDMLLGFGQHWVVHPGAVHLGRIIVAPQSRGQGQGRVLCCQLIDRAVASTGADTVTLRVFRDNRAALDLYTSLGFSPVVAECTEDALFMRFLVGGSSMGARDSAR